MHLSMQKRLTLHFTNLSVNVALTFYPESLTSIFECSQKNRHSNVCLKFLCDAKLIKGHPLSTYVITTINFDPHPFSHLYTFKYPLPPAYVRTFNTEYYPLLITQNRKTLKTPKFLESF